VSAVITLTLHTQKIQNTLLERIFYLFRRLISRYAEKFYALNSLVYW